MIKFWSTLGQSMVKIPSQPFDLHIPPKTFAAFSKFHLSTSNSPNVKIVQFVKGHNFHVEWHFRFEVKMCKTLVNVAQHYSLTLRKLPSWHAFCAKSVDQNTHKPL
jgi:hypothetical protein